MSDDGREELRDATRSFLATKSTSHTVRELMDADAGYDPVVWRQMATELGLHGIGAPEDLGGSGGSIRDLAVVFEEMGAALLCAPFFATVGLTIPALLHSGDAAAIERLVPSLVDGSRIGTVVLNGDLGPWSADAVGLTAARTEDRYHVAGRADVVLDGDVADVVLVAARTGAGTSLFEVDGTAVGLQRQRNGGLDRTRRTARLTFEDVPATLIGEEGAAAPGLSITSDLAIVALTAEQVGGARRCLDMAVDYAGQRVQFGRPIGSFQAIKHRCADMLVAVESAKSASWHAAEVAAESAEGADAGADALPVAASVAKAFCSNTFADAARTMMHIHGGIGFTWEHDAHLYVRRAKTGQLVFGSPDHHIERLAGLLG